MALREQIAALEQLLEVYERETLEKSVRLEQALAAVNDHVHQLSLSEQRYRHLAERKDLLNNLVSQIRQSLDLKTILQTAVTEIQRLLQIDACVFWWYSTASKSFQAVCESSLSKEIQDLYRNYLANHPPAIEKSSFVVDLPANALPYPEASLLRAAFAEYTQLMLPAQTRSKQLGIIHCLDRQESREWNTDEVELLQEVVNQLAIALDQAELYEQSCQAMAQAQAQARELEKALAEIQRTPQLIQTEKMASLGQLVAGVAHEINNPVNFIHGNLIHAQRYVDDLLELVQLYATEYPNPTSVIKRQSQIIEVDFIAEDLPKLFTSMRVGAERIREIVRSLRTFSRLDEAAVKAVNLHEGIEATLLILQKRLDARKGRPPIQVIKEYGNLPPVQCHAGQLNQVLMNILSNAIDALDEIEQSKNRNEDLNGVLPSVSAQPSLSAQLLTLYSPTITIQTEVIGSNRVAIRIADNGPGMPKAVQKRVFDPFFTTKPVGKGTGLGMSVSYQIITETHRGQLYFNSIPGKGTEFVIEIPAQQPGGS